MAECVLGERRSTSSGALPRCTHPLPYRCAHPYTAATTTATATAPASPLSVHACDPLTRTGGYSVASTIASIANMAAATTGQGERASRHPSRAPRTMCVDRGERALCASRAAATACVAITWPDLVRPVGRVS